MYKIRLIHGDEAFDQFVSQLSSIEHMLEIDDNASLGTGTTAKMLSTEIIRNTVVDLAGSYSRMLGHFVEIYKSTKVHNTKNDKINFFYKSYANLFV